MTGALPDSEGGMMRSETLIELKLFNSFFSPVICMYVYIYIYIHTYYVYVYIYIYIYIHILLKFDYELSIERFEPTASQSTVSSPLLQIHGGVGHRCLLGTCPSTPESIVRRVLRQNGYVFHLLCLFACVIIIVSRPNNCERQGQPTRKQGCT